ncbi:hypothetical protein QQ045_016047 [Rhodiola kirilowii]
MASGCERSGRVTQRLENGGNSRSPSFPPAADPSAKSTRSTSRLCRRSQRRKKRSIGVSYVDQDSHDSGNDFSGHGPSESRRRNKKRKSLDELDDDGWARDDGRDEICDTQKGEIEVKSSPSQQLLEKSLLELVIDILQRRDTYEAFGEPVDPDEVADYYAVVKEPMDFGTMRAKLHEGLYTSIDEFENDAFLIPKNAMLFNSPSSVYFKQAQAIEELAKKAFHLLKTEPEKLRTDFSETRRRSRRLPPEPINGKRKRSGSTQTNMSMSLSSNSHHRPSMHTDKASTQSLSLIGVTCSDKDARSTYQPCIYFSKESGSIVSPFYRSSNFLEKVGETKNHYKDSLMRFAQDLGPIAQKIATRKLQPQAKVPTCFQVQIGEKPNTAAGIGIARRGNTIHMGEKRNSQISRVEKVPARESHHGGIILALRSEDTAKGKQNPLGGLKNLPNGTVNQDFVTGFSIQPGKLKPIQNSINGANLSTSTDLSRFHCMGHHGSQTSNQFQRDLPSQQQKCLNM